MISEERATAIIEHYRTVLRMLDADYAVQWVEPNDCFDMQIRASGSDADNRHRFILEISIETTEWTEEKFSEFIVHELLHSMTWGFVDIARFLRPYLSEQAYDSALAMERQKGEDLAYKMGLILANLAPPPRASASRVPKRAGKRRRSQSRRRTSSR